MFKKLISLFSRKPKSDRFAESNTYKNEAVFVALEEPQKDTFTCNVDYLDVQCTLKPGEVFTYDQNTIFYASSANYILMCYQISPEYWSKEYTLPAKMNCTFASVLSEFKNVQA